MNAFKETAMKLKSFLPAVVFLASTVAASSVTIRHDVDDARYREFAKKPGLAAGLVVTRPFEPTPGSGVLIHPRYVLTAGHIGSIEGPADMPVEYAGKKYTVDHVYLFPGFKGRTNNWGGYDLAILRLKGEGITVVKPAAIWGRGVRAGQIFIGVGQGKSGTGLQTDEPIPAGTFRGYENTIDHVFGSDEYNMFVADFDRPEGNANSLVNTLFHPLKKKFSGTSSPAPLPLEGSLAAGDSGSGIWATIDGRQYLIGIATFRIYSCYAAQSYYVNLGNGRIAAWIASVCPEASIAR